MTEQRGCSLILNMRFLLCSCRPQVIQTISAVDKDEPLSGHRFYFALAAPVAGNLNFTLRDNKGIILCDSLKLPSGCMIFTALLFASLEMSVPHWQRISVPPGDLQVKESLNLKL